MTSLGMTGLAEVSWLPGVAVPTGWQRKRVKHVLRDLRAGEGITAEDIESSGDYPVYGGNGVRGYASDYTHAGTFVLIGRQGALCGNVHLASGKFWASEHAMVGAHAMGVDPRWLAYTLRTMNLGQYSVTAAQPGIGVAQVIALDLYAPGPEEQRAIADFLDEQTSRIDTLIDKQTQLITTLRERRAAVIEACLSESESESEPSGQRLKHVTHEVRQGWSPQCLAWAADGRDTWAVLKAGAANAGRFRPEQNKELPAELEPRTETVVRRGDLVVSRANTRDLVGSAAVVGDDYPKLMLSDKLYAFRLDLSRAVPEFVALKMGTRSLRGRIEVAAGGTSPSMQNISREDLANLPMYLPTVEVQTEVIRRIADQTSRIDALIGKTEQHIVLAKERRAALVTAAVSGQIDVQTAGLVAQGVA